LNILLLAMVRQRYNH